MFKLLYFALAPARLYRISKLHFVAAVVLLLSGFDHVLHLGQLSLRLRARTLHLHFPPHKLQAQKGCPDCRRFANNDDGLGELNSCWQTTGHVRARERSVWDKLYDARYFVFCGTFLSFGEP